MPNVRGGYYCSKTRLALVAAAWLFLTVIIAVLVGVLKTGSSSAGPGPAPGSTPSPASTVSPTPDPSKPWQSLRLPKNVLPRHYLVSLDPDFYSEAALTFKGTVEIEFEVSAGRPARHVLVHINRMNVTRHRLLANASGSEVATEQPFPYPRNQFWVLPVAGGKALELGAYRLEMSFEGSLDGINGFYKSSYLNPRTNATRYIVSSKFEPVDARRAFPCFDEPQMKAQFTVKLTHKSPEYFALSNMPEVSSASVPGRSGYKITTFQRSVTMSTYLVCFVICDFGVRESRSNGGKPFRVFAPKHKMDQVDYALQVGIGVQNYFESYFNMSYSLPKQDMIAIPNFAAGAMEHWGLITYRETALLYNSSYHSLIDKFYVNRVIAHELAHMWFGNIVTMQWWDDLWLNEGFASFASYKGMQQVEAQWKTDDMARLFATRIAFEVDDVIASHPIIVTVNTPAELSEVFDTITYRKGQAVILMLEGLMGKPRFTRGIQNYMKKFQYSNAKTSQLWSVLSQETSLPLTQIMDTWTLQMGFPVINVTGTTSVTARQSWYLLNPSTRAQAPPSPYKYLWRVRLNYKCSSKAGESVVWMNQTATARVTNADLSGQDSWVLLNIGSDGFYRVSYPPELWKRFPRLLREGKMTASASERAALVDDALYLSRSGHLSYNVSMGLLDGLLRSETSFPVWYRASRGLSFLMRVTGGLPIYTRLRKFVQKLTDRIYRNITFEEKNKLDEAYLRHTIVSLACHAGHPTCLRNMTSLFAKWRRGEAIPLDIRHDILRFGLEVEDTEAIWNMMWARYQASDNDALKSEIIGALASTKHPWLIYRLLFYAMDPKLIKEQEFFSVTSYVARTQTGNLILWDWYRSNWPALVRRFTLESRGLGRMIRFFADRANTEVQLNEMKQFFKRYPEGGAGSRSRMQSKSQVEANIRWIKDYEVGLETWLKANVPA